MTKKNKQQEQEEASTETDDIEQISDSVQQIDVQGIEADDALEVLGSEIEEESAFIEDLPGESPFKTLPELKAALESLLFTTTHPLKVAQLRKLLYNVDAKTLNGVLSQLQIEYEARHSGIQIIDSAEGYQMCTRPQYATIILQLHRQRKKNPLTTTALEALAIVAYKQPITRAEVEMIRGVESSGVLRNLADMGMLRVVGRKEVVGRPQLYGTTVQFLRTFGLKTLNELPTIQSLKRKFVDPPNFLADALEESATEARVMPKPLVVDEPEDLMPSDMQDAEEDDDLLAEESPDAEHEPDTGSEQHESIETEDLSGSQSESDLPEETVTES